MFHMRYCTQAYYTKIIGHYLYRYHLKREVNYFSKLRTSTAMAMPSARCFWGSLVHIYSLRHGNVEQDTTQVISSNALTQITTLYTNCVCRCTITYNNKWCVQQGLHFVVTSFLKIHHADRCTMYIFKIYSATHLICHNWFRQILAYYPFWHII